MALDITEEIAVDLTNANASTIYSNLGITYDMAVADKPFRMATTVENPYRRETAQYRKDQQDNSTEPGEQSLTGWWLRSQSSFHNGAGIKFYEPAQDEKAKYRFYDSQGVDVWTQGQVSLHKDVTSLHTVTSTTRTWMRSIKWSTYDGVLMLDGWDVDKIDSNGNVYHYVDYNSGTEDPVYGICDDGVTAYFVTNKVATVNKMHMFKKPLTGDTTTGTASSTPTGDVTLMFQDSTVITSAVLDFVKGRIIACINNAVYELFPSSSSLGSPIFSNPSTSFKFTDITSSASDIYVSGYNGQMSYIYRIPLNTNGSLTTLSAGIVVAEFPRGEIVHSIECYVGYMAIGTSKGVRIAQLQDGGGIVYGPLLFTTSQPVYQFATNDRFVWAACGVGGDAGLVRIDLGAPIDTLRFAYANDLQAVGYTGVAGGVAFLNGSDRLAFTRLKGATDGEVWIQHATNLRASGWLQTGRIRFNTTENKYFKYVKERADYTAGGSVVITADSSDITTVDGVSGNTDVAIPGQAGAEYKQFKFTLLRNGSTLTGGPVLTGYQVKAVPASRRQRLIQYAVYCFDVDRDRHGNEVGYPGRAYERLIELENLEATSNVVRVQDFRTGEVFDALIEQLQFAAVKAPSKVYDGSGGVLNILVRKL